MNRENRSLSSDELSLSLNDSEIDNAYEKLSKDDTLKKIGFAEVLRGSGWATNSNEGSLISLVFVQQSFVEYNKTSNTTSDSEIKRSLGELLLSNLGHYKIVMSNDSSNLTDSMVFNVLPNAKEANLENSSQDSIGKLTLTKVSNFSNMETWTGSLVLENQTFDVNLATDSNTFKGKPNVDEGKKVGFWQRLMFWNKN
jgi:hypothetical protein